MATIKLILTVVIRSIVNGNHSGVAAYGEDVVWWGGRSLLI